MKINRNREEKQDQHGHSPFKHMIHMILCCGLPIVIIMALPFIARYSPAVAGMLGIIAPFICPVMMGGMVFMMFRKGRSSCCDKTKPEIDQNELPIK